MTSFHLSKDAEDDLRGIWHYTRNTWSEDQADRYLDKLESFCSRIVSGEVTAKTMPQVDPQLRFCHAGRHYVFWLDLDEPIVIAFLHDRMDLVRHLKDRLTVDE